MGGKSAIERTIRELYQRVPADPVLAPVFAAMGPEHSEHVAAFLAEVFGGPPRYSEKLGGHANMIHFHAMKRQPWQHRSTMRCASLCSRS
jgi:hemoglobin